jgi:hypothetical protein
VTDKLNQPIAYVGVIGGGLLFIMLIAVVITYRRRVQQFETSLPQTVYAPIISSQ